MATNKKRGSPSEQQDLRRRLVAFLEQTGTDHRQAAERFGLSRSAVDKIWVRYKKQGPQGLLSAKRGPKGGYKLNGPAQLEVRRLLLRLPDELGLPGLLWSRKELGLLLERSYGLSLSAWQIGRYLRSWGCEQQRPSTRSVPDAWKVFFSGTWIGWKEFRKKAEAENAEIVFLKRFNDRNTGETVPDADSGPDVLCNLEPAVRPRGGWLIAEGLRQKGVFMALSRTLDAGLLRQFLERLSRPSTRKLYAILAPEFAPAAKDLLRTGLPMLELLSPRQEGRLFLEDCPGPGGYWPGAPCLASCPYAWSAAGLPCEADRNGDVII